MNPSKLAYVLGKHNHFPRTIEELTSVIEDELSDNFSPGQMVRIGKAFEELGKYFINEAKMNAKKDLATGNFTDDDVEFSETRSYTKHTVDMDMIEEFLPREHHPDFWKESEVSGSIKASVDISKRRKHRYEKSKKEAKEWREKEERIKEFDERKKEVVEEFDFMEE